MLQRLDDWMARSPWHPRVTPFFVYILGLAVGGFLTPEDRLGAAAYLPLYAAVCGVIAFLLWRYRALVPELTLRFHWTVLPSAVALLAAWIALGRGYNRLFGVEDAVVPLAEADVFGPLAAASAAGFWAAFVARGIGMTLVVPLFEELFVRSAVLRAVHTWRGTRTGLLQFASDLPAVGEALANRPAVEAAQREPPAFTRQLVGTPLGAVTLFSAFASTAVFAASHNARDWAGCFACGLVWCWMVRHTNRPSLPPERRAGLGPVVWSHGLVNLGLWAWTLRTGDWQFL